jgi:hypothetical protein
VKLQQEAKSNSSPQLFSITHLSSDFSTLDFKVSSHFDSFI